MMTFKTILREPFDSNKFKPIETLPILMIFDMATIYKPCGGLWGCPVNSELNWETLDDGHFVAPDSHHYIYELEESARIYTIDSCDDLNTLYNKYQHQYDGYYKPVIDFKSCGTDYDAIFLTEKGFYETRLPLLSNAHCLLVNTYSWDMPSIYIYRLSAIKNFRKV